MARRTPPLSHGVCHPRDEPLAQHMGDGPRYVRASFHAPRLAEVGRLTTEPASHRDLRGLSLSYSSVSEA